METELKLKVPAADLDRLRSHPMLQARALAAPVEHHLVDTYYDTPQRDLWKHGLTLRVRKDNDKWIQTARSASPAWPVLHARDEWESDIPNEQPRPGLLARQIKQPRLAKALASKRIARDLRPVFQNTTQRTSWQLSLSTGEQLECAVDAGAIAAGKRHTSISELELELKGGDPSRLFDLALALHADVPFQMANDSKAARGYALLDNQPLAARKAAPVRLTRAMTLEDAFQAIALNCLQQIETNVPGVLLKDVESLHQMRVGVRRLRAVFDMFDSLAPLTPTLRDGIDWIAGALGATRDWDVLTASTLAHIPGPHTGALRESAAAKAADLHKHVAHELRAARFTRVLLELNGWLHGRHWRSDGALPKSSPLAERAASAAIALLRTAEQRLRKRALALDPSNVAARHRTRIAAKKARYAAEFFAALLPARRVKAYVTRLAALQDQLGALNDIAVADTLLDQLSNGNANVTRQAAYARGYLAATAAADTARLRKALKPVGKLHIAY
jgi:inorganic triphosphatase YgiF